MTQRDRDRLVVLKKVQKGLITQRQAAVELKLTERQVRRLLDKLKELGDKAVIHGLRGRASHRKISDVPAIAIKGAASMALTRGAQVVSGVGVILTVYDLEQAGERSIRQGSIKPLAGETVRQAGGWAGAWAGAEIGGAAGAAVGIETGPGAIVTGLVGGLIGGVAGFIGADWIGHKIESD